MLTILKGLLNIMTLKYKLTRMPAGNKGYEIMAGKNVILKFTDIN